MPLANIAAMPQQQRQQAFDYSHYQDHVEIARGIAARHSIQLPIRAIFPAGDRSDSWQQAHQAMHTDMNKVLGTAGQNLLGEMDRRWHNQNYQEHQAARAALGI